MKKNRPLGKSPNPAKPVYAVTRSDEKANTLPVESPDLSPERIMDGASTTTAILNQILAQRGEIHQLRDWGINE